MAKIIPPNRKRNVLWPVKRRGKGLVTGVMGKRYEAALHSLLITPQGSLIWAPTFGSRMHLLRTQSLTADDVGVEESHLRGAIGLYIPDIVLLTLSFLKDPSTEELDVTVVWGIPDASSSAGDPAEQKFAFGPVNTTITI